MITVFMMHLAQSALPAATDNSKISSSLRQQTLITGSHYLMTAIGKSSGLPWCLLTCVFLWKRREAQEGTELYASACQTSTQLWHILHLLAFYCNSKP